MKGQLIPDILRQHPGVLVTVIYGGVSLIGMLFSHSLFSHFGVNFFNYAEVSDFLLAALREPMTFVLAGGAVLVTLLIHLISHFEQRWFAKHPPQSRIARAYQRSSSWAYSNVYVVLAVFVLYSYLFLSLYGEWKSEQVKNGDGRRVTVELADTTKFGNAILLGTSNKFVFIYDQAGDRVNIIPNENISRLIVDAQPDL